MFQKRDWGQNIGEQDNEKGFLKSQEENTKTLKEPRFLLWQEGMGGPESSAVPVRTTEDKGSVQTGNNADPDCNTQLKKEIRPLGSVRNSPLPGTEETHTSWVNYFISHNLTHLRDSKEKIYKKISAKMFQFHTNVRAGDNEAEHRDD